MKKISYFALALQFISIPVFAGKNDSKEPSVLSTEASSRRQEAEDHITGQVDKIEQNRIDETISQNFLNFYHSVFNMIPAALQNRDSRKIIYEYSEHFGHGYYPDKWLCKSDSPLHLVEEIRAEERLEFIQTLNSIFSKLFDQGYNVQDVAKIFINGLHRIKSLDRLSRLRIMLPVTPFVMCEKNNNERRNHFNEICSLANIEDVDQFQKIVSYVLEFSRMIVPSRNLYSAIKDGLNMDSEGRQLRQVIHLLMPFFEVSKEDSEKAKSIQALLKISEEDREDVLKHSLKIYPRIRRPHRGVGVINFKNILKTALKIRSSEREEMLNLYLDSKDRLYISDNQRNFKSFFEYFGNLSSIDRNRALIRLIELSEKKEISSMSYYELIPFLVTTSDEDYNKIIPLMRPLFPYVGVMDAINLFQKSNPADYEKSMSRMLYILEERAKTGAEGGYFHVDLEPFFKKLAEYSDDNWQKLSKAALPILVKLDAFADMQDVLEVFKNVPEERIEEIRIVLDSLVHYCLKKYMHVFSLASGLSADDILKVPNLIKSLVDDLQKGEEHHIPQMIEFVTSIQPDVRIRKFQIIVPYIKNKTNAYTRSCFLDAIISFPSEGFEEYIEQCMPILNSLYKNHIHVIRYLSKIPVNQLPELIRILNVLGCDRIDDGLKLEPTIQKLIKIAPEDRSDLLILLSEILPRISLIDERQNLFFTFNYIAKEERYGLLEKAIPFFQQFDAGHHALVAALHHMPIEERSSYLEKASSYGANMTDGFLFADLLNVLRDLDLYGKEVSLELVEKYMNFLKSFDYVGSRFITLDYFAPKITSVDMIGKHKIRNYFMQVLGHLPPAILDLSLDALNHLRQSDSNRFDEIKGNPVEIMAFLKGQNIIDLDRLIALWSDFLRTNPDKHRVKSLADFITTFYYWFALLEDDDIVQEAIRAGILLENSNDPLNPYRIFERLQEKRAEIIDWDNLQTMNECIGNKWVRLNPLFLRDDMPQYAAMFKDLPKHSDTFLTDCICDMDQRVEANPGVDCEIKSITTLTYAALKTNALSDGTLQRLFGTQGNATDIAPVMVSRLVAILAYIENLPNHRDENMLFSEREEAFLRMLASIQGCPNGKQEGINAYYLNILPAELRYSSKVAHGDEDPIYIRHKADAISILREEVEKMFSGQNQLMKDIAGLHNNAEVMQASHQAGYLRNLIGNHVGLPEQLLFDAHTNTLYVRLIELSKQEALQKFFQFFSLKNFIHRMVDKYDLEEEEIVKLLAEMGLLLIDDRLIF